jgi:thiol:disulfide interchange protein DsbD
MINSLKKCLPSLLLFIIPFLGNAQSPVSWNFSSKKTGDELYEISLIATVDKPWHIYSQSTPDGGPLPTKIDFKKNPFISLQGNVKESGNLITRHEEVFGVDVKYFDGNVIFTEIVKLKTSVKTNLLGSIEFMVCNDHQCMPPKKINFTISL